MSDDFRILRERERLLAMWARLVDLRTERARLEYEDRRRTEQAAEARKQWLERKKPNTGPELE